MNQKSKKIMIILILLLTVLACGLGGYTYAKYRTLIRGKGEVDIAKWNFKVNDSSKEIETIKLEDTIDESLLTNGKIAPGTGGKFTLVIDATESEVGINYEIKFNNEKNKPTNMEFVYNGQTYKSLTEINDKLIGNILVSEENKKKDIDIEWRWKYETGEDEKVEENDKIDTKNGMDALNYTFDVVVTGTQIPFEQE